MAKVKVNTSEEKVINRAEKFHIKHLEDLDQDDKLRVEYEYLQKSYLKLAKRYVKIVKMSDAEQHRSLDVNEQTQGNMKKLKSHVISKVGSGIAEQNKIKDEYSKQVVEQNNQINKLKVENEKLTSELQALERNNTKHSTKNKELVKRIEATEKQNFIFDDILEREISQAKAYNYDFSLVMIGISNMNDLQKKLNSSKLETLVSAMDRFFSSNSKKFDLVKHVERGLFYIIFHHTKKETIESFIKKLTVKKKIGNFNIFFQSGFSTYQQGWETDRLMNTALESYNKKQCVI